MSVESRKKIPDVRLAGENYCIDCPDPEACRQGVPCDLVRVAAREERLNRTNNFRIIDKTEGNSMTTPESGEDQYENVETADGVEERYEPQFVEATNRAKSWVARVQPERLIAYGVLVAATIGLLRRKSPKRVRVDYHHYIHVEKDDKKK